MLELPLPDMQALVCQSKGPRPALDKKMVDIAASIMGGLVSQQSSFPVFPIAAQYFSTGKKEAFDIVKRGPGAN